VTGTRAVRWALGALVALAGRAEAQILSPGPLVAAHAELEGVRQCTRCHELGQRGVANSRCLDCHRLLRDRIAQDEGYHTGVRGKNCGECHKDHFGRDFRIVRLDTAAFVHREAGYDLVGGHARVACRSCHQPEYIADPAVRAELGKTSGLERTFLGLDTRCALCHAEDDPHKGRFGTRTCDECHDEGDWKKPTGFVHTALRPGERCGECHAKDDPHAGQFPNRACDACHEVERWKPTPRLDHARTRYPLTGHHREVTCAKCHLPPAGREQPVRFTGIAFARCQDCHQDPHKGSQGPTCTNCHSTAAWHVFDEAFERSFDHGTTRYPLAGKHVRVACASCHHPERAVTKGIRIALTADTRRNAYPRPVGTTCQSCHTDSHEGAFRTSPGGSACDNCHTQDAWVPTAYDVARHNKDTRYRLEGAHAATPCFACHHNAALGQQALTFRLPDQDCLSCHRATDPHGDQFPGRACDECHDTRAFTIRSFDHSRTRYPLDGAHRKVPCASCHPQVPGPDGRPMRRFRPLGTTCEDCHGDQP
jgi:hypothetical protein